MTSQKDIELMNKFYKEIKLKNNVESIKKLVQIITPAPCKLLFDWLIKLLENEFGYKTVITSRKDDNSFIFAAGEMPICAVAHLDTVHRQNVKVIQEIESLDGKNNVLTSPQGIGGDDRCGVIAIIILLLKGYRPSIFFPCGEEVGGRGTDNFLKNAVIIKNDTVNYASCYPKASQLGFPKINWFIEIDRKGNNDVVHYSDSNLDLTKAFEKIGGFKESYGSFTDISHLMPAFGISGVNISSAYYRAHTTNEYIVPSELVDIIDRISKVFDDEKTVNTKFTYKKESHKSVDRSYGYESIFGHVYPNQRESMMSPFGGHDVPMKKEKQTTKAKDCVNCGCDGIGQDLVETDFGPMCEKCADNYVKIEAFIKCPDCGYYYAKHNRQYIKQFNTCGFVEYECPSCGSKRTDIKELS